MTDPSDALTSFQDAYLRGVIDVQRGEMSQDIYLHVDDMPDGSKRLTYVKLDGRKVTALVNFVLVDPIEGRPCFMIGYAVPEAYRGQGQAKGAVRDAIAEMRAGFTRAGLTPFYVEAIVGADNLASQAVAAATLSSSPERVTDELSGQPALQYIKKVPD